MSFPSQKRTSPRQQLPQEDAQPKQYSQNQHVIHSQRSLENQPQNMQLLDQYIHSKHIKNIIDNTPQSEEYLDCIRMLILLDNGEQRLVTFALPNDICTVQDILNQVGIRFDPDSTPIQISEVNSNGVNYVVAVGNVPGLGVEVQKNEEKLDVVSIPELDVEDQCDQEELDVISVTPPSKLVETYLALCAYCGYLSEDFNKCARCKKKMLENVRFVPYPKRSITYKVKSMGLLNIEAIPKIQKQLLECETIVVSSDEEDDLDKKESVKNGNKQLLEKSEASSTVNQVIEEPSSTEKIEKINVEATTEDFEKNRIEQQILRTLVKCKTVQIASYRFVPPEPIEIDSNGMIFRVPHPTLEHTLVRVAIEIKEIVKVLISFHETLPVLFYYLLPSFGKTMRNALNKTSEYEYYFDSLSKPEQAHNRIILIPETLSSDCKQILQSIYRKNSVLEELSYKEANDMLMSAYPKSVLKYSNLTEIKPILIYPLEGRCRITINTEDYLCLGRDQFLNDVIIDFYLKYLHLNMPKEKQDKVHVFSTFFYKRLTMKPTKISKKLKKSQPTEFDPNLTPAQKRHQRVKTWTKNVNIFEKDFIIVPINEHCHWFLAIICYPNMDGTHTMDGQPIKIEPKRIKKKRLITSSAINLSRSAKEKTIGSFFILYENQELSDKDEAEGDDSELDSDDSGDFQQPLSVEQSRKRPPIKQPCILIFDSLAGTGRSRVVATLRDYLTCEYKAKLNVEKNFTKDVIKGACPKVPQQTNFTDCGLYLLQYAEQFFNDPIKDYHIPISHLKNWFDEATVTKKRENIAFLIKFLMKQCGKDPALLPNLVFPSQTDKVMTVSGYENFVFKSECPVLETDDEFIDPDDHEEITDKENKEYLLPSCKVKRLKNDSENLNKPPFSLLKTSSETGKNEKD